MRTRKDFLLTRPRCPDGKVFEGRGCRLPEKGETFEDLCQGRRAQVGEKRRSSCGQTGQVQRILTVEFGSKIVFSR